MNNAIFRAMCAVALLVTPAAMHSQTVSFAGTQTALPVTGLKNPFGIAVDQAGNVFVSDPPNHQVVELPAGGGAQTVVGSGLSAPQGLAVDSAGDVFIADTFNSRVVELPAGGGAQTTVGANLGQPIGVAVDAKGDVFIADQFTVLEVPSGCTSSTCQIKLNASPLPGLAGIAADAAGDVFIANQGVNNVIEIAAGGAQTIIATGLNHPSGVAVNAQGDVFVADTNNSRIVEIPAGCTNSSCQITVAAGLSSAVGVAVDGGGDVFIANEAPAAVLEVQTTAVTFGSVNICSAGQTTPAPCSQSLTLTYNINSAITLGTPRAVTQGASNLDFTVAGGGTCTAGSILAAGSQCTLNVTFTPLAPGLRMGAAELFDSSGNLAATTFIHGIGLGPAVALGPGRQTVLAADAVHEPFAVAVDAAGDLFIVEAGETQVVEIPAGGGPPIGLGTGPFSPGGAAVDGAGNLFVPYGDTGVVAEIPANGGPEIAVGSGLSLPAAVAVDGSGNVFIADLIDNRVVEVPADGGPQITVTSGLFAPWGLAVDAAGNLFIADTNNNRVVEVPAGGGAQTTVGSGLSYPQGVAVDAAGDVFIADTGNNRVVELPAGGAPQITVVSGLNLPQSVAVDAAGDLFIADTGNFRVLKVQRSQPPTLTFTATPVNSTSSDSPQSVTLENIGNMPLVFSALTVGTNFAQVAGSGTPADCTGTSSLNPGASCNLSLSFAPTASGPLNSAATLTDNALNGNPATQTITLNGAGIALTQTITFSPISNQVQGTPLSLTASASSGLPVSFASLTPTVCSVSGTMAALTNPGTCTIQASQPGNSIYAAATPVMQSFTVIPSTNFTITPEPPAEIAYRGQLAAFLLVLKSANGFNANVSLSCSGGPAGARCADLPQTVRVNGTAYAVSGMLFPKNTTPGVYTITFTGISGSLTNTANAKFTVK